MAVHRVLVQAQQQVHGVPVAVQLLVGDTHHQEDVPASDDGLVGVVGVEMKAAADEYPSQDVAGSGDALSGLPADAHREVVVSRAHVATPP